MSLMPVGVDFSLAHSGGFAHQVMQIRGRVHHRGVDHFAIGQRLVTQFDEHIDAAIDRAALSASC